VKNSEKHVGPVEWSPTGVGIGALQVVNWKLEGKMLKMGITKRYND
jgi:hypothetical protein